MNPPPPPPPTPKKEVQLHGPRPSPLKVNKESVKIKKPPPHPRPDPNPNPNTNLHADVEQRQPVVIYTVSPKVIHATVSEFMSLVQRLTGPSPSSSPGDGGLSPAARLASIHKTSPNSSSISDHNRPLMPTITTSHHDDFMASIFNNLEDQGRGDEMGQFSGILSPAPATLPPIIPNGFFSHQHDVLSSPFHNWQGIGNNFNFMPSPGPASAPLISPSPSAWDLFNNFLGYS